VRDEQIGIPSLSASRSKSFRISPNDLIERRSHFVAIAEIRIGGERPGDADSLPLSSREFPGQASIWFVTHSTTSRSSRIASTQTASFQSAIELEGRPMASRTVCRGLSAVSAELIDHLNARRSRERVPERGGQGDCPRRAPPRSGAAACNGRGRGVDLPEPDSADNGDVRPLGTTDRRHSPAPSRAISRIHVLDPQESSPAPSAPAWPACERPRESGVYSSLGALSMSGGRLLHVLPCLSTVILWAICATTAKSWVM